MPGSLGPCKLRRDPPQDRCDMLTRRELFGAFGIAVAAWDAMIAAPDQQTKKDQPKLETVTLAISGMT